MDTIAVRERVAVNKKALPLRTLRWTFISVYFVVSVASHFIPAGTLSFVLSGISTLLVFATAILHCYERYGMKNAIVFLVVTWIVSNGLEALSIQTGFPFGNYHYTVPTEMILEVPWIIMVAYFATGYMSWVLAHVLTGQYGRRLEGVHIFLVPVVSSFIMVMWDVVMDPINSTIGKNWIWEDGGNYFGVPISNYFGWFFVVFLFYQIFAIYISKYDTAEKSVVKRKSYWLEASAVYGIQSVSLLLTSAIGIGNREIYSSMGLVNVFTMLFVTVLSLILISNNARGTE
jgi:Predicted membrane protein